MKNTTYNFIKDKSGGESLLLSSSVERQSFTLFSYESSADFHLPANTITPNKLTELADLLETNPKS